MIGDVYGLKLDASSYWNGREKSIFHAEHFKGLDIEIARHNWFMRQIGDRALNFSRSVADFIKRCNTEADLLKHAEQLEGGAYEIVNHDKTMTLTFKIDRY